MEQTVMDMRINGFSRKEIAAELSRSELTVKTHFQNISKKMSVNDEVELVVKYLRKYRNVIFIIAAAIMGCLLKDHLSEIADQLMSNILKVMP